MKENIQGITQHPMRVPKSREHVTYMKDNILGITQHATRVPMPT